MNTLDDEFKSSPDENSSFESSELRVDNISSEYVSVVLLFILLIITQNSTPTRIIIITTKTTGTTIAATGVPLSSEL